MKVLVQRVKEASCIVEEKEIAAIGKGYLLFVSFHQDDDTSIIPKMAKKVANLRIFEDEDGKMNHSIKDLNLQILSISQFTLEAKTRKGNRPSFTEALDPAKAETYYHLFTEALEEEGLFVYEGAFQARMDIKLVNEGPVTILLERDEG